MWNVLKILQIEPNLTWPKLCNGFGVGVWVNAHVSSKAKPSWWRSSTQAPLPPLIFWNTCVGAWAYQASNCFSDLGAIYSDQHWSTTIYFFETITKPLKKLLYFLIARKYQLYINTFTYLFNFSFKSRSCSHLPRQLHHPKTEVLVRSSVENKLFWKEIVINTNCYQKTNCY